MHLFSEVSPETGVSVTRTASKVCPPNYCNFKQLGAHPRKVRPDLCGCSYHLSPSAHFSVAVRIGLSCLRIVLIRDASC